MALKEKFKFIKENVMFESKKPHVYRIENIVNKRYYIGVHIGCNTKYYAGSSPVLSQAYNKYGMENFYKTLIKEFNTFEEALEYEKTIITDEMIEQHVCYNTKKGGIGGFASGEQHPWYGRKHSAETKAKMSVKRKAREKPSAETRAKMSASGKGRININKDGVLRVVWPEEFITIYQPEGWVKGKIYPEGYVSPQKGKKLNLTDAQRKNLSDKAKLRKVSDSTRAKMSKKGKNSKWINKDGVRKFIQLDTVDDYLKDGWKLGRK